MDEIITEAFDYVNPKKADEAVADPKAKKGKGEAAAPANPFEGKDVTLYKELAQAIKDEYLQGDELP